MIHCECDFDINPIKNIIDKIKDEGRYRVFIDILRNVQNFPKATRYKNVVDSLSSLLQSRYRFNINGL